METDPVSKALCFEETEENGHIQINSRSYCYTQYSEFCKDLLYLSVAGLHFLPNYLCI
jgi:hypothetical protein